MNKRDRIALITGVLLGVGSCLLIFLCGMAAGAALLVTLLICPLITSLVASERLFLSGLVPNILIVVGGSIFGALSPYNRTAWDIWNNSQQHRAGRCIRFVHGWVGVGSPQKDHVKGMLMWGQCLTTHSTGARIECFSSFIIGA